MTIYLHAISALPALYDVGGPFTPDPVASLKDSSARIREGDRIDLRLQRLGVRERPVHVLVDSARKMTGNRLAISHCSSGRLVRNSFTEVSEGILASTPELCFLQLSAILDLVDTIRLGYELCGSYVLDSQSPGGFMETDPLTSPERIASFIESVSDVAGIRRAKQAIKWVRGSSRSPRETALSMMLLLPTRYGGWQLGHHVLNHEVDVGFDVEGSVRRFVDVYWPEAKVGLEYDSDLFHFDRVRNHQDRLVGNIDSELDSTRASLRCQQRSHIDQCLAQIEGFRQRVLGARPIAEAFQYGGGPFGLGDGVFQNRCKCGDVAPVGQSAPGL